MTLQTKIKEYWEHCTPLRDEPWDYKKMRDFRYNQLQTYQLETIKFERFAGKKVLDVGCGASIDALEFASHGAEVTATDITDDALSLTKKNVQESGLSLKVMKASALDLPFANETFACVYSFGVLHHVPEIDRAMQEIQRVLKTGGTFIGMLYHKSSLLYQYSIVHLHEHEELTEDDLICKYSERNVGCPYTRAYTKAEAIWLMDRFFSRVNVVVRYNVIDLPEQRKVKVQLPEGHSLGWHLIIEAVK